MSAKRRLKNIIRRIGLGHRRRPPKQATDPPFRNHSTPSKPGAGNGPGFFMPTTPPAKPGAP
jgi:hypothetical protein